MKTFEFSSASSPGTKYVVTVADDGKVSCNCRGWTNRRGTAVRSCKHTKDVIGAQSVKESAEFQYLTSGLASAAPVVVPSPAITAAKSIVPAPMLASAIPDSEYVTGPAFDAKFGASREWAMEEKMDGHRCTLVVDKGQVAAFSRPRAGSTAGLPRDLPAHVVSVAQQLPSGIYDGELCVQGGKSWDVSTNGAYLIYIMFDVLFIPGLLMPKQRGPGDLMGQPYTVRRAKLLDILRTLPSDQRAISCVESTRPSWDRVQAIWKRDGEGVILKRLTSLYHPGGRGPEWLKVKQKAAAVVTVTGFTKGEMGPYSVLNLRDDEGVELTVKTLGNDLLAAITANPSSYVNRRLVISYQIRTPDGRYRHPQMDHFLDGDGPRRKPRATASLTRDG